MCGKCQVPCIRLAAVGPARAVFLKTEGAGVTGSNRSACVPARLTGPDMAQVPQKRRPPAWRKWKRLGACACAIDLGLQLAQASEL